MSDDFSPEARRALMEEWDRHGVSGYGIGGIGDLGFLEFDECSLCTAQGLPTCEGHWYWRDQDEQEDEL